MVHIVTELPSIYIKNTVCPRPIPIDMAILVAAASKGPAEGEPSTRRVNDRPSVDSQVKETSVDLPGAERVRGTRELYPSFSIL